MEQENNKEAETPVKTLPESNMNKQEENKEAMEAPEEASIKLDSNKNEAATSRNKTPRSLKTKSKISKKPLASKSLGKDWCTCLEKTKEKEEEANMEGQQRK